jgi:hypothetical protein
VSFEDASQGVGGRVPTGETLRLTFRVRGGQVELVDQERIDMIAPQPPSEPLQAGEHGGSWAELKDAEDRTLAQRLVAEPLIASVEVFSPEGTIERRFGPVGDRVFEVLLPAVPDATTVVLVGETAAATLAVEEGRERLGDEEVGTRELARFDLAPEVRGEQL